MSHQKPTHYAIKDSNAAFKFSVKDVDTQGRIICAVLNTYNYLDSQRDVLMPGCAAKSIKLRGVNSTNPQKTLHALFHNVTRLPGKIKTLDERTIDGKQVLYMESKLVDTVEGNDTLTNYLEGIYNQHSIGFDYVKIERVEKNAHGNSKQWENLMKDLLNADEAEQYDAVYRVDEIDLYEGSTVSFGANALTPCVGMKSINKDAVLSDYISRLALLEKTLRNGTQSDEMMFQIELQVKQLKQVVIEIFDQFDNKTEKEKQQEKETPVEDDFYSKLMKEIQR